MGERSSHSELLDEELEATDCTPPTPYKVSNFTVRCCCGETTRAVCGIQLDHAVLLLNNFIKTLRIYLAALQSDKPVALLLCF